MMRASGQGGGPADVSPPTATALSPRPATAVRGVTEPDLGTYRCAVAHLLAELSRVSAADVAEILAARLAEPALGDVLVRTAQGMVGVRESLLLEIARHRHTPRNSPHELVALIRSHLLSQIDLMWWGDEPVYRTDTQLLDAIDLVELDWLRHRGLLVFCYRKQPRNLFGKGLCSAQRRIHPNRTPPTTGLRFSRTRREAVALLNELGREFVRLAPPGTPPLWVTFMASSVEHQHRLRRLGYATTLFTGHCHGYAVDVEMNWYRRFGADQILARLLRDRQDAGQLNVIDEGHAWHLCLAPRSLAGLRRSYEAKLGELVPL